MKLKPFITFGEPDITEAEREAVDKVLRSGWLSTGERVQEFEMEFEKYMGGGYAVAVSSCSVALTLALTTSGIGEGDIVLCPPLTYCATLNAILNVGAVPEFIDVDKSGLLDLREIHKIKEAKAIVPVDYLGAPFPIDEIEPAFGKKIKVIEDAAHGFGGMYLGHPIGAMADFSCFSFYPTKNITCGEGGMVVCKRKEDAELVRTLSNQGLTKNSWNRYGNEAPSDYQVVEIGFKANMSDIHAAIGLTQMARWPEIKQKRDAIWNVYENAFGKKEAGHSKHLYTIYHVKRDELRNYLYEHGIGTGIHFSALHLEPAYKDISQGIQLPMTEFISRHTLSLPISAKMTKDDAERVCELIHKFQKGEAFIG